jgi:AAA+ ATPase superfamily predicted ATPase
MAKKPPKVKDTQEKIIGRIKEQALLRDLIASKKSEFVAVYGRRRVGKTIMVPKIRTSV